MKRGKSQDYREFIRNAYVLQLTGGSFSAPSLSRKTGKSYGYTSSVLSLMSRDKLAKQVSERSILGSGGRSKLMGLEPAEYVLTEKGRKSIRVVLTGGVFDIVHPGHVSMLREARRHGDVLVVVLARDSLITRRKRRPVSNEQDRLFVVSSLEPVDAAILGSSNDFSETIERVGPDVVSLGYDQGHELRLLMKLMRGKGTRIEIVRTSKSQGRHSTSMILSKIKGR